jgi:hypothetical protein
MRSALDPAGHRVPRTKPTCLLHTWRPHRRQPFALVLHLHQHQSSRNLHLQYLAKNQSTQHCQSLVTQGSDHPPVLEPHMVLTSPTTSRYLCLFACGSTRLSSWVAPLRHGSKGVRKPFHCNQHLHHANSHDKLSASHTRVTKYWIPKYVLANPLGSKTRSFSSPCV